jgi:Domain of unknown function (DUF4375)
MTKQLRFDIGDAEIDANDYFAVIEPVFWAVNIYDGPDTYENDLARFSMEQRYVLGCHWYLSEVYNGGHHQFYYNSTGIVWNDAKIGFESIGTAEIAAIIDESARRLGGRPSLYTEERQHQLANGPSLDDLDEKLFALENDLDLDVQIMEYIRKNRKQFYFSGLVDDPRVL